jgi:CBS domain-containing protein
MVSSVVTIEPGTGVVDAAKRMIEEEKGPLPIVEGGRPVAIVTDRDIVAHVVAEGRDPRSVTADDVASHELVTIGPDEDVNEARRLMDEHQLDRILSWRTTGSWGSSPRRTSAPTKGRSAESAIR